MLIIRNLGEIIAEAEVYEKIESGYLANGTIYQHTAGFEFEEVEGQPNE